VRSRDHAKDVLSAVQAAGYEAEEVDNG